MTSANNTLSLPRTLGDGLLLRRATPADTEAVAGLNGRILADPDESPKILADWTRDLMSGRHPTTTAEDFIVVEDTNTGQIVSSIGLIPQTWHYENIPFGVGRPELVATEPAYRRRGLVRTIFEVIHTMSAARGHQVQGITGIPWFYRQFGYEYALPLGGGRHFYLTDVPALKEGEAEPFQLRPADAADIPTLMELYERQCAGKLITTKIDEIRWRYDLNGHSPDSIQRVCVTCILEPGGQLIGYFSTSAQAWTGRLLVWEVVVVEGRSLNAVLPTVIRALKAQGEAYQPPAGSNPKPITTVRFALGLEHPVYEALAAKLGPFQKPYAWYIRVADLPGFIRHIAPVLEKRLAGSVLSGYSGELKIGFFRGGLRLAFEQGRLTTAADWSPPDTDHHWDGAEFPPLVFLQLLFGYRSLDELCYAFPDCYADEEPTLLLNALFPKRASLVFPLG